MKRTPRKHCTGPGQRRILAGLGALCALTAVLSLLLGAVSLDIGEMMRAVLEGDNGSRVLRILLYSRIPRTVGALIAGAALAVAGQILQVVLNNPLAGPNIIGVNAGAGLATVLVMALVPGAVRWLPAAAFLGALLCALLIEALAGLAHMNHITVALAGVAVTGIAGAVGSLIKTLFPDILISYNTFSVGSLYGVDLSQILAALPYILAALIGAWLMAPRMEVLLSGAGVAAAVGMNVRAVRFGLILLAAILAGAAVSFGGLIGFIGLLVPHVCRIWLGTDQRKVMMGSALLGSTCLMAADLMGRLLFAPYELPAGILLSLIGGILFLVMILRRGGGRLYD